MTQNSINTGYIASSTDAIIGADTRKLIVPSSLLAVSNSIRSSDIGSTYNLRLSFGSPNLAINTYSDNTPSSSNPAYVVTRSKGIAGKAVLQQITGANTFSQTSMLNNLFGTVASTAWSSVMPMYVYCVTDDSDANPVFALSRVPHLTTSPTVANSGSPSSSTADTDQSFFYFNSGTVLANYDQNPCVCIGSLEISKSALDAWTISTVHPIGDLREQAYYTFPTGQNGNAAGKYMRDNGGTAPTFSFNVYEYSINRHGLLTVNINIANDGGTAGVGAVDAQVGLPIKVLSDVNLSSVFVVGPATRQYSICATQPNYFVIRDTTSAINIQNNFFTAGPRGIATYFNYQLQVD